MEQIMNKHDAEYDNWFKQELDKIGPWKWNDTGVDIILTDQTNADMIIGQIVSFFESIDAPLMKTGNVTKLYEAGFTTVAQIVQADASLLANVLGSNGHKVWQGIRTKLTNIPLYRLLGAFSQERGLGVRKMKKLQQALSHTTLMTVGLHIDDITTIEGFDYKTAQKVVATLDEFFPFLKEIDGTFSFDETGGFSTGGEMEGQAVVFTGFRDKALQAAVEAQGGRMQSAVSGKTTLLVTSKPNSNSGKTKKARDLGIRVVGVDELKDMLGV